MSGFILVFIVPLFCPAVAQNEFTVRAEQDVYQAEENSNITMAWIFPVEANESPDLHIDLRNVKLSRSIYFYSSEMDTEPYLHELYRGRLHCDPQFAMKGQFECLLTDLRLSDTGTYQCIVVLNGQLTTSHVTSVLQQPLKNLQKRRQNQ